MQFNPYGAYNPQQPYYKQPTYNNQYLQPQMGQPLGQIQPIQQAVPQPVQQTMQQTMQPPNTNMIPLAFVNGMDGAKAYIVAPNQTIYLRDTESNVIFEKIADAQGNYSLTMFEAKKVEGKDNEVDVKDKYITKSDLEAFTSTIDEKLNNLSTMVETLTGEVKTKE